MKQKPLFEESELDKEIDELLAQHKEDQKHKSKGPGGRENNKASSLLYDEDFNKNVDALLEKHPSHLTRKQEDDFLKGMDELLTLQGKVFEVPVRASGSLGKTKFKDKILKPIKAISKKIPNPIKAISGKISSWKEKIKQKKNPNNPNRSL